jgi:cyclic dehypoxanthinyl futalosine synthase
MSNVTKILERVTAGKRLSAEEILLLYEAPIEELRIAADEIRRQKTPPEIAYYVISGTIDYTNVCSVGCGFCHFYRTRHHPEASTLTREEILGQIEELSKVGARLILFQGGINPDLPFEWYEDVLRAVKSEYPGIHIDGFSPEEVFGMERLTGRSSKELLERLKQAGLDGLPGASAEILVDDVRRLTAPARISTRDWCRIIEEALEVGLHSSWVSMVFGMGETASERVAHLTLLRQIQDRALERSYPSRFFSFKVWPMRLASTRASRRVVSRGGRVYPLGREELEEERVQRDAASSLAEQTAATYLREVAIARLALDNIPNHSALWLTQGFKVAQMALQSGANDLQETGAINAVNAAVLAAGGALPQVTPQLLSQIFNCIQAVGRKPTQRDAYYRVVESAGLQYEH